MAKKLNRNQKIAYLNKSYCEWYTEEEVVERLIYLTNKSRHTATTEHHIRKCYKERRLGALLERLDPIGFELSF